MAATPKSRLASEHAVVTANRLADGRAVWLAADGSWSETLSSAAIHPVSAAEPALEQAQAAVRAQLVVGPYLVDVADGQPVTLRERIRAAGPTVGHARAGR